VPVAFGDDIFLSGAGFLVPASGIPNISGNNASWTGQFYSDQPGVSVQWKWAVAAYTTNMTALNTLGVKSIHSIILDCAYLNGDQAGTPENKKSFLTSGGSGGGGSNYTGSYSGTVTPTVDNCVPGCSNGYERCSQICTAPPG
jgi:hypothetical protein